MKIKNYNDLYLQVGSYANNASLAVSVVSKSEGPYARLTVNLGNRFLPPHFAFVDVNNFPDAEKFIEEYELGEPTGIVQSSGYVMYPLYTFNPLKLDKYSA